MIKIYNSCKNYKIDKKLIKLIVKQLSVELSFKIENLEISFVDKETILQLNKEYLNHDYFTDILTFDYSETINKLNAEIIICCEIANENAENNGVTFLNEITRLVIHGILHLSGYDDTGEAKKTEMTEKENILLKKLLEVE
ncbi:MAG: rRNA maturation RNase YbeY [Ignavibacteriaceae bacterium]|nr:rRNA maturation RNase YbeY [Ignavibacteriaceae bacterium]